MERPKGSIPLDHVQPLHYDITLKPTLEKKNLMDHIVEVSAGILFSRRSSGSVSCRQSRTDFSPPGLPRSELEISLT